MQTSRQTVFLNREIHGEYTAPYGHIFPLFDCCYI